MSGYISIPWMTDINKVMSLWVWDTPHFRAQITTDEIGRSFSWNITDLSQGREQALYDGFSGNFKDAENAIREVIGKSYPPKLGYRKYSGHLATTFRIFTKENIDFGPMEATKVILKVRTSNAAGNITERTIAGMLKIQNYMLEVTPDHGSGVVVPPSHIMSVKQEFGGFAKEKKITDRGGQNVLRTYQGVWSQGCTGRPGMLPNTVEHSPRAEWCPVHDA